LARIATGTGIEAGPISYAIDGVEYVSVPAGFGGAMNQIGFPSGSAGLKFENHERVLVFKLNGGPVPLPALRHRELQPLPAAKSTDPKVIERGMNLFERCGACHSYDVNAIQSFIISDEIAWRGTKR
jgi:quinohemoprotein ethanol dehydrogenase